MRFVTGPRMVRDVFRLAKENSPSIIFIDEIDAIATKRFDAQTGADREVRDASWNWWSLSWRWSHDTVARMNHSPGATYPARAAQPDGRLRPDDQCQGVN